MNKEEMKKRTNQQSKPLRLLVVEDSPQDAEISVREIRRGGFDVTWQRVDTAETMGTALREETWDIVVCDYNMPNFSGFAAITLLKETGIDIPLIIVSGTIGEETAVECMRHGAQDYIMKDKLSRLVPAIERELKEAESRRIRRQVESQREAALDALHQSEYNYRLLFENAGEGILIAQGDTIKFANPALEEILGYPKDIITTKPFTSFIHPDDRAMLVDRHMRRMSGEPIETGYRFRSIAADGTQRWLHIISRIISWDGMPASLSFVMDITDHKQAEDDLKASEEKYRSILETMQEGYFEVDFAGNFTFFNDSLCRFLEYSKEELMGMNNRQYVDEENAKKLFQAFHKVFTTGEPTEGFDWQITRKDGTKKYVEASISLQKDLSGKPIGFRGIVRDVTERRRAEEALKESENKYRLLAENAEDVIFVLDMNLKYIYVSPSVKIMRGYEPEEVLQQTPADILTPSSMDLAMKTLSDFMELEKIGHQGITKSRTLQLEMWRKDGTTVWTEVKFSSIRDENQQLLNILGVTRDITDRKRTEEALQKSEANYKQLFDNSPTAIYQIDFRTGRFLKANDVICEYYGCSQEEITSRSPYDLLTEASRKLFLERLHKMTIGDNVSEEPEFEIADKKGKRRWLKLNAKYIYDSEGLAGADVVAHEVTERKQQEEEIRQMNVFLNSIIENIPDMIFLKDAKDFRFIRFNRAGEDLLGYSREEMLGKNDYDFFSKEQADLFTKRDREVLRGKDVMDIEEESVQTRNKGERILHTKKVPILNENGEPEYLLGISEDITELRQAEQNHRMLFREMLNGFALHEIICDGEGRPVDYRFISVNPAFERMTGLKMKEIAGRTVLEVMPNIEKHWIETYGKVAITGEPAFFVNYSAEMGKHFEVTAFQSEPNKFACIFSDITERIQAEEERQQTLERLRKAFSTTVQVMASAVEVKDPYTAGHQLRVANLARVIATEMGLPSEIIEGIRMAGTIHDIGKLSVPAEILTKPTKLSDAEFSIIKEHSQKGYDMLKDVDSPWPLAQIVYQHHERMNGSGYPRKLKGDEILMEARIMAVADVVEAMASYRPYRPALGIEAALAEIEKNRETLYDSTVTDVCLKLFREQGYQLT